MFICPCSIPVYSRYSVYCESRTSRTLLSFKSDSVIWPVQEVMLIVQSAVNVTDAGFDGFAARDAVQRRPAPHEGHRDGS